MSAWQPSASIETLKQRAQFLQSIRQFFLDRNVLEVETPILSHSTATDPYIESLATMATIKGQSKKYFLQTSPEFYMKRLLAAGYGCIYQLGKVFRDNEYGKNHQIEFTMLEWYRINFSLFDLMHEVEELLAMHLPFQQAEYLSYCDVFKKHLDIDPIHASISDLSSCADLHDLHFVGTETFNKDTWLQCLLSHLIEPQLGQSAPTFIYHYPASQAALAQLAPDDNNLAERFEVYYKGIELANGFHELSDPEEQRRRMEEDLVAREQNHVSSVPIDELFLQSLGEGFPDCSGVALGVDRLFMLVEGKQCLSDVMSFSMVSGDNNYRLIAN